MTNVVHIDRYRAVTTISEERVVQMLNWSPPKHDPSPLKAIRDTLVQAKSAWHKLERAGMKTGPMTAIIVALEDAHDQAENETA